MNFIKIITVFNWIVIAVLGFLVIAETLFPAKGGDAAGRGLGIFIYWAALIAVIILLILNLLPYTWSKYTAFGLIVIPVALFKLSPVIGRIKRGIADRQEYAKPIFEDKERDDIARAVRDGEPEKVKKLLATPVARLNDRGELLGFAVSEASHSSYKPEEKLTCVKILLDNGASLDSANTIESPIHMGAAATGRANLLRLLLEQGASANARQYYLTYHIIFEAIGAYHEPEQVVRVLLDFGADLKVTALFDDEKGKVTPLYRAAQLGRWGICAALLEKGADRDTRAADGTSFQSMYEEALQDFSPDGYCTQADFDRLKAVMESR